MDSPVFQHRFAAVATVCVLAAITSVSVRPVLADVLLLANGGRVEGKLLNPKQDPRTEYEIELEGGGRITLEADKVTRVIASSPAERRYLEVLTRMPATAEGNWKMANWCGDQELASQRLFHLEETVLLDPDHEPARRALGHIRLDEKWGLPQDLMAARGYVKYKGRWRVPQDIELIKRREAKELAAKKWNRDIKLWRRSRDPDGRAKLAAIDDRAATSAIVELLQKEKRDTSLQGIYISVLGRLHTAPALSALIELSITSDREETRQLCLDQLVQHGKELAMLSYLAKLKSSTNLVVRRAAMGLQRVADSSAVEPLMEALVTEHRFKVGSGGPGQLSVSQGNRSDGSSSGTGFGVSGGPTIVTKQFNNREVLSALLPLAGGANFQYDEAAWKRWFLHLSTPDAVDLRRDL